MGDNREKSHDSKDFGLVDYRSIEGRAIYRISPVNNLGKIK